MKPLVSQNGHVIVYVTFFPCVVSKEPMYSVAVPPPPASMENSNAPNSEVCHIHLKVLIR